MADLKRYREELVYRRDQLISDLANFETGDFKMALRRAPDTEWRDETKGMIEHYKRQIEAYQRMIAILDDTLSRSTEIGRIH